MNRDAIRHKLCGLIMDREGYSEIVYLDTEGNLTVGYGHLVLAKDKLKEGDKITEAQAAAFLNDDLEKALDAAIAQAKRLGRKSDDFVVALGSVSYQLGTAWPEEWPHTFLALQKADAENAIQKIEGSVWIRQTPVRAHDFIAAIRKEYGQQEKTV